MNQKSIKAVLSTALAVTMLAASASAAPLTALEPSTPVSAYTIENRNSMTPISVQGKVTELGETTVSLKNDDASAPYAEITVNVGEDTIILDSVTGESKTFKDLKKGETLFAYVSPAMTRSIPPISNGFLILCNIPKTLLAPTFAEIQSVTKNEDGSISALTDNAVILHMNEETELVPYLTKNVVGLDAIQPGVKVLSWYSIVALSMPAQATPSKVMVFPYGYESYVTANETSVTLDGDMVLEATVASEKLMVPVRALAEALGCEVKWDAETNSVIASKGDEELYRFVIGGENVTVGDAERTLTVPATAANGVTSMAIDDLLTLHNLKLVENSGF